MRQRHRQAQAGRVERRPARPDEVGGHQGLAVTGRQGVAGPERGGGQDRHEQDERREVRRAEDRGQVAAPDTARHGAGGRGGDRDGRCRRRERATGWGRRAGHGRDRRGAGQRCRVRDVEGGQGRTTGRGDDGHGPVVESLGQQVRRVVGQAQRRAGRPQLAGGGGQGHAGAGGHDLAPAEAIGRRAVRVRDPAAGRQRSGQRHVEATHHPHRGEAADAGREREPRLVEDERLGGTVDGQAEVGSELLAGRLATDIRLVVGYLAVAVGIEPEARLEGRDLGLVDDDVEPDRLGFDADPGVVVDREVAERMGGGDGRDDEHRRHRDEHADPQATAAGAPPTAGRPPRAAASGARHRAHHRSAASCSCASVAASGSKLASSARASVRSVRARVGSPTAAAIMPAW